MVKRQTIATRTARHFWIIAAVACIAAQVAVTIAWPDQYMSMRAGTAALVALCAARTVHLTSRSAVDRHRWRWHLVTAAFAIWAISWTTSAIMRPSDAAQPFLSLIGLFRQVLFLIALLPTSGEDQGWRLRSLDVAQVVLLGVLLAILSWPGTALLHIRQTDSRFLYVGHVALAIVAIASYLRQSGEIRRLIGPLAILHSVYAVTSIFAAIAFERWGFADNSAKWVFGDIAFVAYLWATSKKSCETSRWRVLIRNVPRDLPPLLLAAVILMLSVELGRRSLPWGMGVGIIGLIIYATRTTILNERYLTLRDQLIATEEARGRALIDIVHEIRSPLGSVALNAALLTKGDAIQQPHRRWVEQLETSTTRVTTLLNDVLELERLDAGLIDLNLQSCEMESVITAALAVVSPQADEFGITLSFIPYPATAPVMADQCKLSRVLINLLGNAIRFTPTGGHVTISIVERSPRYLAITIEDTGVGIPPEAQKLLFKRFGFCATPVNGLRGSGLGLSICEGMTKAMGGELSLESVPAVGTTAKIVMPVYSAAFTGRSLSQMP